ncbi:MAG TPA: Xaa-Pro peptidase family protein [Alphaproteobacteria bacterium]|nr:Xaa-Pro peptidase family protein [Alphaproteobacteria bacterium]
MASSKPAPAGEFTPTPPVPLVDVDRCRRIMAEHRLDALIATEDANLYYLSGHAPDSVLAHFYDTWDAAILPSHADAPPCLLVSEYDLAYLVTHPTWMPELRVYGAEWSSAAGLLDRINRGIGVDTDLRQPLRALYQRTLPSRTPSLIEAILRYIRDELSSGPLRIGFDDLRLGAAVQSRLGNRLEAVDGLPALRRARLVKTAAEIDILRAGARINDEAVRAAAGAVIPGRPWYDMVRAYRRVLTERDAKPSGERGMLFGSGPDGSFVLDHRYVESKRFAPGDSVVLDAICTYRMYHADMARTAVVGEPRKRHRELYAAVRDSLEASEARLRPGIHTADVQKAAAEVLRKHGLEPGLATLVFHPIGLNVFDYASAEEAAGGWTVESSTAMNFEVFYRDPEYGGMHLEDTVLVTSRGVEHFSAHPRDMIVAAG